MNFQEIKSYYNTKPVHFVLKESYELKEDNEYIGRFKLKDIKEIADVPVNQPMKPTKELVLKSIKLGLVMLISYKGAKDKQPVGHERVIYFMVYGKSQKGDLLIRGYHLNGWSVSSNRHINKIWRMFRYDRIQSITFTGSFYRLPPSGYNANDLGMRGGIIAKADFNEIRRNQQNLLKADKIQNKEDITLESPTNKFVSVKVKVTDTQLDLNNALDNAYINNIKDTANLRLSFLKSIFGNKYICIINALGQPGNTVKVLTDKGINMGIFKVMDSISGDTLKKIKAVKGNAIFDLYVFDKKI